MSRRQTSIGQWLLAGIVVLAAIAAGVFIWRKALHPDTQAAVPAASTSAAAAAATTAQLAAAIQYPIAPTGPAPADSSPVPMLDDSDTRVAEALAALAGGDQLRSLLLPEQIVRHLVATIDALPRQGIATSILPLRTPAGAFMVEQAGQATTISARNAERYAPYMQLVEHADPQALVAAYVHYYPLFQQAYRELGYPHGYFNDRLVAAIDDMLAAPTPGGPIALTRGSTAYLFADPNLQSLSVGQRMLIRLGPDNETRVKAKLREIRALLVRRSINATP